ncbi:hypothetical protein AJ79_09583 [Helicocarpus griseus UAMH5409]|uniref:Ubiquitin 3 binding protein But2 C-terminal domain-containing protein n=1 Tax=Helicocarpus griseus UAMH5409 TaxID=1447875 RepID=A0A2B7WIU3_9EURO|nr:hypothetical protein AJ79_09583 [Helicocarpus griseus UAMH5409]
MFISHTWLTSLTGLTLLGTTTASPAPDKTTLAPRACSTIGPSIIDVLYASTGDNANPGQYFTLARGGNPAYNTIKSALTFEYIPAGATGCMLAVEFPVLDQDEEIATGPSVTAEVWSTAPWTWNNLPTYNNPPQKDQMVGTVNFPTQKTTSVFKTIVASDTCEPVMSFLVEHSGWQQGEGTVHFYNTLGWKVGLEPIGFSLIYNC